MAAASAAILPAAAGQMASAQDRDRARAAGASAPPPKPPTPSAPPAAGSTAPAPQTPPPSCAPGIYLGTFAGTVQVLTLPVVGITGTVTAELVASKSGDSLAIATSRIEGMANEQTSVTAKLIGIVNCKTLELEGGALEEGVLTTRNLLGENSTMTFSGKAEGAYSNSPPALKGTWQAAPDSALGGSGSWSIALSQAQ